MTGSPPMVLPSAMASLCLVVAEIARGEEFAQRDHFAARIGQFDADGVTARHHGDAGRNRRHGAGDVVGEADDARGFDARRGLEFVERHHRARTHIDDVALDAEVVEHAFKQPGVLFERVFGDLADRLLAGLAQQHEWRQLVAVAVEQRGLSFLCRAAAGSQGRCGRAYAIGPSGIFGGSVGFGLHRRAPATADRLRRRRTPARGARHRVRGSVARRPVAGNGGLARKCRRIAAFMLSKAMDDGADGHEAEARVADGILFLAWQRPLRLICSG